MKPEKNSKLIGNLETALMRIKSSKVVWPRKDKNFDYTVVLL